MTDLRPIHLARVGGKTRPVLVLTRQRVIPHLNSVTVAPITSTIRGLDIDVIVGPANGLDHASVVNCDNVVTIPRSTLGRHIGFLLATQEPALALAFSRAYDLELL